MQSSKTKVELNELYFF